MSIDSILEEVLEKITPGREEHEEERRVLGEVFNILEDYPVEPILVGSLAKDTDLAGNKDLDVFIQFPSEVSREELEAEGLRIGKDVFNRLGVGYEIDYAEHPYVKGSYSGHDIEIVPCYSGARIMSSVDRTPLHNMYVRDKLEGTGLNSEIRLLKRFMKGVNVYGAEAKVEGFSGYLVEVLTIHYGSFMAVLEAARRWNAPEVLDPEGLWEEPEALPRFFTGCPLIVVDPVDRSRNVAAAVSEESFSRFVVSSDEFLESPSMEYFFPVEKPLRPVSELKREFAGRGSRFAALVFRHERMNVNTLYSQLRKTLKHAVSELEDREFVVFRSGFWTNEEDVSALLFEFSVWELPELMHHLGPPITQDSVNQERFTSKYGNDKPYIKDGRWVVDTRRRYRRVEDLLGELAETRRGFGKTLRQVGAEVLVDGAIFGLGDDGWLRFLNEYLE